jgi:hypothetical protein
LVYAISVWSKVSKEQSISFVGKRHTDMSWHRKYQPTRLFMRPTDGTTLTWCLDSTLFHHIWTCNHDHIQRSTHHGSMMHHHQPADPFQSLQTSSRRLSTPSWVNLLEFNFHWSSTDENLVVWIITMFLKAYPALLVKRSTDSCALIHEEVSFDR